MNSRRAVRTIIALALLAALVPRAVAAQAVRLAPAAPAGEIRMKVFAQQPDGAFATDLVYKLRADGDPFLPSRSFPERFLGLASAPNRWHVADPEAAAPSELTELRPGVLFTIETFDAIGHAAGSLVCAPLRAGEQRTEIVPLVARHVLTVRVLDLDGQPVRGAGITIIDPGLWDKDESPEQFLAWWGRTSWHGTTGDDGVCVVGVALAPGRIKLDVKVAGSRDVTRWLDEVPADGAPVTLQLTPVRDVVVRVMGEDLRPAAATSVCDIGAEGELRFAELLPGDSWSSLPGAVWRLTAIPAGPRTFRVRRHDLPDTLIVSEADEITAVLVAPQADAAHAAAAPGTRAALALPDVAPGGIVQGVAIGPDGAPVVGVSLELFADGTLFLEHEASDELFLYGVPPDADRRLPLLPATGRVPAQRGDVLPGVPFRVRAIDVFRRELGELACDGLAPGETRRVTVPIDAVQPFTVRVLDAEGRPVPEVSILLDVDRAEVSGSDGQLTGTTDARGDFRVHVPLAFDGLVLRIHRAGWESVTRRLESPPSDGDPVLVRLAPGRPVLIHVVDADGFAVPVTDVTLLSRDEWLRHAEPVAPETRYAYFEQFAAATWRAEDIASEEQTIAALPAHGPATTVTSSSDDVTLVVSTHRVLHVRWDEGVAAALQQPRVLRLVGDGMASHRITDEERVQRRADIAAPLGAWTLRLSGGPGTTPLEMPIDVSADGATGIPFTTR